MATARLVVKIGDPVLRARAEEVGLFDENIATLIDDLWETMWAAHGTGLAAPQIGLSMRVLVAKHEDQRMALINPEIIDASKEEELGTEGCLSIPGFVGLNIRRAATITVKARDVEGKKFTLHAEGWLARVLQHEIDHLDGVLYIDRLDSTDDLRLVVPEEIKEVLAKKAALHEEVPAASQSETNEAARTNGSTPRKRTKSQGAHEPVTKQPRTRQPRATSQSRQPRNRTNGNKSSSTDSNPSDTTRRVVAGTRASSRGQSRQ